MNPQIKEILEKQLQTLSERVDKWHNSPQDLYLLSKAMCEVARQLQNQSGDVNEKIVDEIQRAMIFNLERLINSGFAHNFSENAEK